MGRNFYQFPALVVRWYVKAARDKKNRRAWRTILLETHGVNAAESLVQDLEADERCLTTDEKVKVFVESTGRSRATYFRVKAHLEALGTLRPTLAPQRQVKGRPPERIDLSDLDYLTEAANADPGEVPPPPTVTVEDIPAPNPRTQFENPPARPRPTTNPFETDDTVGFEKGPDDE